MSASPNGDIDPVGLVIAVFEVRESLIASSRLGKEILHDEDCQ